MKVKTSIYVDKELWSKFKMYARRRGMDLSSLLEDMIADELVEEIIDKALGAWLEKAEDFEIAFQPVEPVSGTVSDLVREERRGRIARLSGQ